MRMLVSWTAGLVLLGFAATAAADGLGEPGWPVRPLAAPSGAFELTVSSAFTKPVGSLAHETSMEDVAAPGLALDLGLAYRLHPRWSIGLGGHYDELTPERADTTRGVAVALTGSYHFAPMIRFDPWLEMGSGYRLLWENTRLASTDLLWHGVRPASIRFGIDVRASSAVAISPFVGADANVFLYRAGPATSTVDAHRVSSFLCIGMQGRFDFGGTMVDRARLTSSLAE